MEKDIIYTLIDSLEVAKENLSNDITLIGFLQQAYFMKKPNENFVLYYGELENKIETLLKSMIYNMNNMEADLNKVKQEIKYKGL